MHRYSRGQSLIKVPRMSRLTPKIVRQRFFAMNDAGVPMS
jgi:hypothetical protein